jgi:hypothetical protein
MRRSLWLILGIYVLLAAACRVEVPLFEVPDEHHHNTVQHLAATRRLPVASERVLSRREAASGGTLDDRYALRVPSDIQAGRHPVQVGLYDPRTDQRLPVRIEGVRQPYGALFVGWLAVE